MAAPVINPEPQFCDQNGIPYSSGTITTYTAGTSTPKSTWLDPDLTALQTNPIVLDAAGRCTMWGDGDYRLVLHDSLGNLVWDQPATTIVSAAMEPVVSAPTIPDALNLLGVTGLIAAEATARSNADSAEQSARIAADNAITAAYAAADTTLQTNIANEAGSRAAADANLQSQITALPPPITNAVYMQHGTGTSDASANVTVTFPVAYTTHTMDFELNGGVTYPNAIFWNTGTVNAITTIGATGQMIRVLDGTNDLLPNAAFTWFAIGV